MADTIKASESPSFTIITVCKNARLAIYDTISSLSKQTLSDYEYLVIDGASCDGTIETVRKLTVGYNVKILSEHDSGIYYAMNKGIQLASGKWIYFLNAGDCFVDEKVLDRVLKVINETNNKYYELAYGDVIYTTKKNQRLVRFDWLTRWNLRFEQLCHQAVFSRRDLFNRIGLFDTKLKINADYDWLLRVFTSGAKCKYMGFPIAFYDSEGISDRESDLTKKERKLVCKKYLPWLIGPIIQTIYRYYKAAARRLGN